jgi:flagellar biosynthetic protein FlhB
MAEDSDDSQKTEDPTSKKLDDAASHGDVAQTQELKHLFILATAALLMIMASTYLAGSVMRLIIPFVQQPHAIPADGGHLVTTLLHLALNLLVILALPWIMFIIASIAGNAVQHPIEFNLEKLTFDLSRLSLISGLGRLLGMETVIEFGKGIVKLALIGGAGAFVMWQHRLDFPGFINVDPDEMIPSALKLAMKTLMPMLIVLTLMTGADYFLQRYRFFQRLRMTKQEVKEEMKQQEGDPMIKARLRGLRMQRARQRMMQAVPTATVVVTNPTHFAVALKYDEDKMAAPICVAKGADLIAQKIRELAEENGIPLMANPPLARALFSTVEIDQPVPPQHYKAVAEVIGFVWRMKGKRTQKPA